MANPILPPSLQLGLSSVRRSGRLPVSLLQMDVGLVFFETCSV